MSGNLYQLRTRARVGEYVAIGGPYDTYGRVVSCRDDGIQLIRGLGHTQPQGVRFFYDTESA